MIIRIDELQVQTIIGTLPHERTTPQTILVSYEMEVQSIEAELHDDINGTVDYAALNEMLIDYTRKHQPLLLEKLVHDLLQIIADQPLVLAATLEVSKPGAIPSAKTVRVQGVWRP